MTAKIGTMEWDRAIREPAKSVVVDGKEESLTLIGSGATCLVYETENGTILKEFFPLINGHIPAMARVVTESDSNPVLINIVKDNKVLNEAYQKSRAGFEGSVQTAKEIYAYYRNEHAGMCIVPEACRTLSGIWQRCPYTGGYMLYEYIASKREKCRSFGDFFAAVLHVIYLLSNDLLMYHECGFVNLDIKPQNLYAICADRDSVSAVRNLDFGSARKINSLIADIEASPEVFRSGGDLLVKNVSNAYFSTTEQYYDSNTVNDVIGICLESDDAELKRRSLMRLDAIALLKLMIYALSDSLDFQVDICMCNEEMHLKSELYRVFDENTVLGSRNLYEEYDCYYRLYELIGYVFRSERVDVKEIRERIHTALCTIGRNPTPAETLTEKQSHAVAAHKMFSSKRSVLSEKKLHSVADIYRYARGAGLICPPSCGELYYHAVMGVDRACGEI